LLPKGLKRAEVEALVSPLDGSEGGGTPAVRPSPRGRLSLAMVNEEGERGVKLERDALQQQNNIRDRFLRTLFRAQ